MKCGVGHHSRRLFINWEKKSQSMTSIIDAGYHSGPSSNVGKRETGNIQQRTDEREQRYTP